MSKGDNAAAEHDNPNRQSDNPFAEHDKNKIYNS